MLKFHENCSPNMGDQVNDVDEIFESFVKKKLKQLGIKRLATKSHEEIIGNNLSCTENKKLKESLQSQTESNSLEPFQQNSNAEHIHKSKTKKGKKSKKAKKEKNNPRESKCKSYTPNNCPKQNKLENTETHSYASNSSKSIVSRSDIQDSCVVPIMRNVLSKNENCVRRSHREKTHKKSRSENKRSTRHRTRSRSPLRRSHSNEKEMYRKHSSSRKESRQTNSYRISKEDKVRLLEIAKANALAQHRVSSVASSMSVSSTSNTLKNSSLSVKQFTEICKDISSNPEALQAPSTLSESHIKNTLNKKAKPLPVHHPFKLQEMTISLNIPSKPMLNVPVLENKPVEILSKEFPVSCGQQHRRKEVLESVYGKWQAVAKDEVAQNVVEELVKSDKVFVVDDNFDDVDLPSVIAERISATRELQDNPASNEAQVKLKNAQQKLDSWTKSKQVPGRFTGQAGVQPMSKHQLEGGRQAWFKPGDLENAKQVDGIGKFLLQKMGWKPGTPLGKTMPGQLEPLFLNVKNDRRGLSCFTEESFGQKSKKLKGQSDSNTAINIQDLTHKHPVSALMEICSKRHWPPPQFSLVDPADTKSFAFKVNIRGDEYKGHAASNKKQAKLLAATVVLQCMGLLPQSSNQKS